MTRARRRPAPLAATGLLPTPEAMSRGEFELSRVSQDGVVAKVAIRKTRSLLERLHQVGLITKAQRAAGERYEADHRLVFGSPGGRDSCVQRVGGEVHETDAMAERIAHASKRQERILNSCGPRAYALVRQVAVYDERIGRERGNEKTYAALRHGLDAAARIYGIPEE